MSVRRHLIEALTLTQVTAQFWWLILGSIFDFLHIYCFPIIDQYNRVVNHSSKYIPDPTLVFNKIQYCQNCPYLYCQNCSLVKQFITVDKYDPGGRACPLLQSHKLLQTFWKRPKAANFESWRISLMLAIKWSHHLPSLDSVPVCKKYPAPRNQTSNLSGTFWFASHLLHFCRALKSWFQHTSIWNPYWSLRWSRGFNALVLLNQFQPISSCRNRWKQLRGRF